MTELHKSDMESTRMKIEERVAKKVNEYTWIVKIKIKKQLLLWFTSFLYIRFMIVGVDFASVIAEARNGSKSVLYVLQATTHDLSKF